MIRIDNLKYKYFSSQSSEIINCFERKYIISSFLCKKSLN